MKKEVKGAIRIVLIIGIAISIFVVFLFACLLYSLHGNEVEYIKGKGNYVILQAGEQEIILFNRGKESEANSIWIPSSVRAYTSLPDYILVKQLRYDESLDSDDKGSDYPSDDSLFYWIIDRRPVLEKDTLIGPLTTEVFLEQLAERELLDELIFEKRIID